MNLHNIVAPAVAAINPMRAVTISASTGYTTNADGTRVPTYAAPVTLMAQLQELSSKDLQQTDGLNLQTETKALYLDGSWEGAVRADGRGGDLLVIDQQNWLVVKVLENWGGRWRGWTKLLIARQV